MFSYLSRYRVDQVVSRTSHVRHYDLTGTHRGVIGHISGGDIDIAPRGVGTKQYVGSGGIGASHCEIYEIRLHQSVYDCLWRPRRQRCVTYHQRGIPIKWIMYFHSYQGNSPASAYLTYIYDLGGII